MSPLDALAVGRLDLEELRRVLSGPLRSSAAGIEIVASQRLKSRVHRLQLEVGRRPCSIIVKRLAPEIARRNRLVAERWLPAANMAGAAPAVLGILPGPDPASVWLIGEDLGGRGLSTAKKEPGWAASAVALIARLHRSFSNHPLLGEVRLWGGDLGVSFHSANLRDAIRAVEALGPMVAASSARSSLRDRLLARLRRLLDEAPRRAAAMERHGGPETLLHGDLWLENLIEYQRGETSEIRLIDWDHAGVGPALYDVSTFLYRFPREERRALWETYRRELGPGPWELPEEPELNLLCETAEHARVANCVIWPALAALRGEDESAFEELAIVERWFEEPGPALP